MACNECEQTTPTPVVDPCSTTGCPIQLDFACAIYNKSNSNVSKLTNLGLPNGTTLQVLAEAVDTFVGANKVAEFELPHLRSLTTINTLKQFTEAVDSYLQATPVAGYLGNLTSDPSNPLDGQYWFNAVTQELKIRVNGATRKIQTI